jgi:hypothetical protein
MLTLYVSFLIISLYTYKILVSVNYIKVYVEQYFHLIFGNIYFIYEMKFDTNYNMF